MANSWFKFKQFIIQQDKCAMKVTTDACLFGAWIANEIQDAEYELRNVLDIGTGTGLLSLLFAQKNKDLIIDAVEIDADAAGQAKENIAASPWHNRISIIQADARTLETGKKYDAIISNPPFYENELKSESKLKNLAHHNEGLLLPQLLNIIRNKLELNGNFYLLLPYKRNDEIIALLKEYEMSIFKMVFVRQSVNHDFFRIMLTGGFKKHTATATVLEEISIKDINDQYTPEFVTLLKEFYLYL